MILAFQGYCQIKNNEKVKGAEIPTGMFGDFFLQESYNSTGAPTALGKAIAVNNEVWVENIDDLIGRIVKVTSDSLGNETVEIFDRIVFDSVRIKLSLPKYPDIEEKVMESGSGGSLKFMGIEIGGSDTKLYSYKATTLAFGRITQDKINNSLISDSFRCADLSNCDYFYINAAVIRTCETIRLEEKKASSKLKNLPLPSELVMVDGEFYSGNKSSEKTVKNVVFFTVLNLPRID